MEKKISLFTITYCMKNTYIFRVTFMLAHWTSRDPLGRAIHYRFPMRVISYASQNAVKMTMSIS